jgi:hypothetical protein
MLALSDHIGCRAYAPGRLNGFSMQTTLDDGFNLPAFQPVRGMIVPMVSPSMR